MRKEIRLKEWKILMIIPHWTRRIGNYPDQLWIFMELKCRSMTTTSSYLLLFQRITTIFPARTTSQTPTMQPHLVVKIENLFLLRSRFAQTDMLSPYIKRIQPTTDLQASENHNNIPLINYQLQDHHKTEQSEGEKHSYRDKTKLKYTNSEQPEKIENSKENPPKVIHKRVSDQPKQCQEGDLQGPQITIETFLDVPTSMCNSQSVSVHKRSNPEEQASQRARSRGRNKSCSPAKLSSRSNSLNSKKPLARVCDSERQRIHKLARKCIRKQPQSRSIGANFSLISPSNHTNDTAKNYGIVSHSSASSQSDIRELSDLNQKYLKELIFPFARQGPELSEQEESGTQKNIQKFVIERIIRINPCAQDIEEAVQFSDLTEDEEEENFAPRNTTAISLEAFIESRPAISGTSTCPGFAPSTASQPSYIGGALGSRAVSDLVRDTFMRFCGAEDDERSEDNFLFHPFPSFDHPIDRPRDVFDDAIAGDIHPSSDERTRKYELMEEFLRDSMLKSLYSQLQGEAPRSWESATDGFQNQAKTMVFQQDTQRTIMAPTKLLASTSTDDKHQDTHCSPSDPPVDVIKNPYNAFKELIWNSQFTSSDTQCTDNNKLATKVDSQLIMAFRVNNETRTDRNVVQQKSFAGLQKYSEIMDLLEIFPGQRRHEDPQEEKTRKWIEKINKNSEEEKEEEYYALTRRTKGRKSRKKDYRNSHKISRVQLLTRKGNITSRVNLYKNKRYHIPVQSEQSSSDVSICDSNYESRVRDKEGQSFLVYMNEGGYLFKERCKHGISNRLPKKPPYWFRGTNHNWISTVKSEPFNDNTERKPAKDRKHTHRSNVQRHHRHKHRGSSDDSLSDEEKHTRKKETIVKQPKKRDTSERQHRDVRVPSRSVSVPSSSESSASEKRVVRKPRYSRENDRKPPHTRDHFRHRHRDSLGRAELKKYEEPGPRKNKRISEDSSKQNDQPKSSSKKSNLKKVSSTSINESESSSTYSSSHTSLSSRRGKNHVAQVRLVKHPNPQTARLVKHSHSPMPIKRVKVKRKVPNVLHNNRHRLITADSKSSASYENVNVKHFIDFLATLSRNTISTLTNKKKALRLYRHYLSSPRRR
uniref:Uncharacterized protein n=1 Tax=Lygus hesperus TaxID=30085 RepID=A0A0A9WL50_LYGHE